MIRALCDDTGVWHKLESVVEEASSTTEASGASAPLRMSSESEERNAAVANVVGVVVFVQRASLLTFVVLLLFLLGLGPLFYFSAKVIHDCVATRAQLCLKPKRSIVRLVRNATEHWLIFCCCC